MDAPDARSPSPPGAPRVALGVLAFSLAAVALLFAWAPLWPMHDGPQHVLMAHIERTFADPAQGYARFFVESPQFAGRGFALGYVPLEALLGVRAAPRVALALLVLLSAACSAAFVWALEPRRTWLALPFVPLAFSWSFYMGFYPFSGAVAAGTLVLAAAVRLAQTPASRAPKRGVVTAAFTGAFAVLAMLHVVGAALVAGAFGAVTLGAGLADSETPTGAPFPRVLREYAARCARALFMVSPVGFVLLGTLYATAQRPTGGSLGAPWSPTLAERLALIGLTFAPGPWWRGPLVLGVAVAGVACTAAAWRRARPVDRALAIVAALYVTLGWLSPLHLRTWNYFSPRFLPLAVLFGVSVLPLERAPRWASVFAPAVVSLFALLLAHWPVTFQRATRAALADVWSGLEVPLVRSGPQLVVALDPPRALLGPSWERAVPEWYPINSLGQLYASVHGGVVSSLFRGHPGAHAQLDAPGSAALWPAEPDPFYYLSFIDGSAHPPSWRPAVIDLHAAAGRSFSGVLVLGREDVRARFAMRGYAVDYARGILTLAHFEGCPLEVSVRGAGVADVRTLDVGWFPLDDVFMEVALGEPSSDGVRRARVEHGPCGPVWVRPQPGVCAGVSAGAGAAELPTVARRSVRLVRRGDPASYRLECALAGPAVSAP